MVCVAVQGAVKSLRISNEMRQTLSIERDKHAEKVGRAVRGRVVRFR
jgi:hypothetical protein